MVTETQNQEGWTKPPEVPVPTEQEAPKAEAKVEEKPQAKTLPDDAYKGLQRTVNKLQAELEQARAIGASLNEVKDLKGEIASIKGALELVIANYGKTEETEGFEPLPKQYARLTEVQRQTHAQQVAMKREVDEAMADITEMAEDVGLETNAPELKDVWKAASAREALSLARRITRKIAAEKQTQTIKETLEKERQKLRQDLGLDSADTSTPSGKKGGKRPSVEELRKTPAVEVKKKFDSGEWADK